MIESVSVSVVPFPVTNTPARRVFSTNTRLASTLAPSSSMSPSPSVLSLAWLCVLRTTVSVMRNTPPARASMPTVRA
jgi:hypothetical protein